MRFLFLITILLLTAVPATAQTDTTITYQGQLQDASGPVTDTLDLEFRLFDSLADGNQIGTEIEMPAVPVTDGLFQVELDFGAPYGAEPTYLEVMVGNEVLAPRQSVSAAPLAIHALSLDAAYADNRFWKIGGNAGTTPGTDILGTTDSKPLEVHVNGVRALRLEPGDGPNLIAGSAANKVASGVVGASVAGGHDQYENFVADDFGVVGGGRGNQAGSDDGDPTMGKTATVGGGSQNTASGGGATVGGGFSNTASNWTATVGGGADNYATGVRATISGGAKNNATGYEATVPGGSRNSASGDYSFAAGRRASASGDYSFAAGRRAQARNPGAFVWADSTDDTFYSTENDQFLIRASGGVAIGTIRPDRDLHIKQRSTDNAEIGLQIERSGASENNWGLYIATSDNLGFRYNDTLKSRINASDGAYVDLSDANAKRSIKPLSGVLDKVLRLKPRSYRMKDAAATQPRSTGLIAQEVEALFPDTVSVQDGLYGIKYSQITVLNTAALIELNAHFSNTMTSLESESEKRFAALESENADLRSRVTALSDDKRQMRALANRNRALEDRLARLESLILEDQQVAEQ